MGETRHYYSLDPGYSHNTPWKRVCDSIWEVVEPFKVGLREKQLGHWDYNLKVCFLFFSMFPTY